MKLNVTMELTLPQDGEKLAILAELSGVKLVATNTVVADPAPKTRAKKAAAAEPAPAPAAPAAPFDPMMDMGGASQPAAPIAPAAPAAMTEAESTLKAQEANKALVKAFPKIGAENLPEGFHMAKKILAEFGVARTTDLVHAQRVAYVAKIDALIAARPA